MQESDKELLALAAKAAGYDLYFSATGVPEIYDEDYTARYVYNPLQDDGDALRLALKLYMFDGSLFELLLKYRLEEVRKNRSRSDAEIIRLAITRVAAEIGRNA